MATQSPLNWNQRKNKVPSLRFTNAEDYARHMTAKTAGPTGMHERETIQSGEHKGKTPSQVAADYMESSGLPSRTAMPPAIPHLGALPMPQPPVVADSSAIDPGMVRQPRQGIPLPSVNAPSSLLPTIQPPVVSTPAPMASPAPVPVSSGAAPGPDNLLAQGMSDQAAGITQRGSKGSVLYNNGASMSPTSPTGGRVLTMPNGQRGGSVSMRPTGKPATFDGVSGAQFGQLAAARQGRGNAFTRYQTPSATPAVSPAAPGPAQQARAAFNAANPNVKTQAEIDQIQQTFQANRDNLATIQAQKASAAGTPRAVSPGSPPLANAAGQTGNLLTNLTQPKPSLAPLLSSSTPPPLRPAPQLVSAGPAAAPPASLSSRSKSAIKTAVAAAPKPQPIPDEYYRSLPMEAVKGTVNLAKGAFNAVSHVGEKIAEQFDTSFIHTPPPLLARKPAPGGTGPFVSLPPGIGARAAGGPVQGGQPYLVGEQGPEIVVPDQSGTVIPNHQVPSLRQPARPSLPRKPLRPTASVVPIKPPSLLATFG